MKVFALYSYLLVSIFSAPGYAMVWLDSLPSMVHVGETFEVGWSNDRDYIFELHLVREFGDNAGWESVKTIFKDRYIAAGNSSYDWTVPSVGHRGSYYGLWLSGDNSPPDGSGYANITNWFTIEDNSNTHTLSAGQIAGAVVGVVVALFLGTTAAFIFLRARASRKVEGFESDEGSQRESFDSVVDAKTKAHLAMEKVDA